MALFRCVYPAEIPQSLALTPVSLYVAFPSLPYPTLPTFPGMTARKTAGGNHLTYCEARNHDLYCQGFELTGNQPVNTTAATVVASHPTGTSYLKLHDAIALKTFNRTVLLWNRDVGNYPDTTAQQIEESGLKFVFDPMWMQNRQGLSAELASAVNGEGKEIVYIVWTYTYDGAAYSAIEGYRAENNLQAVSLINVDWPSAPTDTAFSPTSITTFQNNFGVVYSGKGSFCGNGAETVPFIKFYDLEGNVLGDRLCVVDSSSTGTYVWEQQLISVNGSIGIAGYNIEIDALGDRRVYVQAVDPSTRVMMGSAIAPFPSLYDQTTALNHRLPIFKLCGSDGGVNFVVYMKAQIGSKVGIYARECKYSAGSIVPIGDVVTITEEDGTLQFAGGLDCAYLGGNRFNTIFQMFQTSRSEASIVSAQSYNPYFVTDGFQIKRNGTTIMDSSCLKADDLDTDTDLLKFIFGNVTHGQFEYVSTPGVPISECTQKEIREGAVLFRHDGSKYAPSYSAMAKDPQGHTSEPSVPTVDFIPDSDPEIGPISGSLSVQQNTVEAFFGDHLICTNRFGDKATVFYQMPDGTPLLSWVHPYSNGTAILDPGDEVPAKQYGLEMICFIEPFPGNAKKTFYFLVMLANPPASSSNPVVTWVKWGVPLGFSGAGTTATVVVFSFGILGTALGVIRRRRAEQDYEKRAEKSKAAAMLYAELRYPLEHKKISEFNSGFYAFTKKVLSAIGITEDAFNLKSESDQKRIISDLARSINAVCSSRRRHLYKWDVSFFGRSSIDVVILVPEEVAKKYGELTNSTGDEYVQLKDVTDEERGESSSLSKNEFSDAELERAIDDQRKPLLKT